MDDDKIWIDAKLNEIDKRLKEADELSCFEEEQHNIFSLVFDEVLERLPVEGPLLSQIKVAYEDVIDAIVQKKHNMAQFERNQFTKSTEEGTIRNYQQYLSEVEVKLALEREECLRIQNELEAMSNERMTAKHEQEKMLQQYKLSKPHMTSAKRLLLRLQGADATDAACLEKELQRVKQELDVAMTISERKYVTVQRKHTLQKQLEEKEEVKSGLVERARILKCTFKILIIAQKAVLEYSNNEAVNQSHTNLADFVIHAIDRLHGMEESIENDDDPEKEAEAEMILDCYESFNDFFQDGLYEQAAIMAANSPKGVLRSFSIMEKFRGSLKPQVGDQCPLLMYCEALLESAAIYRPISLEESLVCAECILQQDGNQPSGLAHWIEKGVLPCSTHLGKLIYNQCKCTKRCICGHKGLAFSVFKKSNSTQEAALCLVELNKYISLIAFGQKSKFTKEDFANILYLAPSVELAAHLVLSPRSSTSILTLFEAMHLLTMTKSAFEGIKLLKIYLKQTRCSITEIIFQDERTNWDTWQSLLQLLQTGGFNDWAMDIFAALIVKIIITQTIDCIKLEQPVVQQHTFSSDNATIPSDIVGDTISNHLEFTSHSDYSSSSEEDKEAHVLDYGNEHDSSDQAVSELQ